MGMLQLQSDQLFPKVYTSLRRLKEQFAAGKAEKQGNSSGAPYHGFRGIG